MKNRIISVLLLVTMLATALLTSCSGVDTGFEEETSSIPAVTLHLYGTKGEGTTDEAIALVQKEINRITEDKYKTTVVLKLFSEDEYDTVIEDAFVKLEEQAERNELAEKAASAAAKAQREAAKLLPLEEQKEKKRAQREYEKWAENQPVVEEEIDINMSDDVQLDIFMVDDYDYYTELMTRELITEVSTYVNSTYNIITKFVNPMFIGAAKLGGTLYGIPANRGVSAEGYYYAVNTALAEKYGLELSGAPELHKFNDFFASVKKNEKGVAPLLAPPEKIQGYDFYNDDMENTGAYGVVNREGASNGSYSLEFSFVPGRTMSDKGAAYLHFNRVAEYRSNGYYAADGADPLTTDFAVGIFKGSIDSIKEDLGEKGELYTYYPYSYPKVVTEDAFASTFVVGASSKYPARAVELISGFCINEELRNLITFGVENIHYEVNSDGETIVKLNNDYNMGFETYGNSLIGYVPEELGADYQANAINNNKSTSISAFVGYSNELEVDDIIAFEEINAIASEYIPDFMNAVYTKEELAVKIDEVLEKIAELDIYPNKKDEDEAHFDTLLSTLSAGMSDASFGGTGEIDNSIITKEEKKRREELAKLEAEVAEGEVAEGEVADDNATEIDVPDAVVVE